MSAIYIIAGAPGVGKSTKGADYIDPELDILNEDETRLKYKELGFPDYEHYAMTRVRGIIKHRIIHDEDFALELNLGFDHQYEYILNAKTFKWGNKLNIILFHTDFLQLCLDRARIRHENGLHLVEPDTIRKMYQNTLPLLKKNFAAIDSLVLLDAKTNNRLDTVAVYDKESKTLDLYDTSPLWFKKDLQPFMERFLAELKIGRPRIKPWESPRDKDEDQDIGYEPRRGR
jgi:predicted ABC-type ATPase